MNGFRKVALFGALAAVATAQAAWVKEEKLWEMNFTPAEMRGLDRKLVKGNSYAPEEGKDGALHCLSTNKVGTRNFSMPLDLSRIAGPILVEARVKGHNVERGTRFYCGPNLMIHYTNPPGSRKMEAWRKLANEFGTFDWKTWTLVDIIPSDVANLQMVVVLQECRGELWVDDITIWRAKEIPDDNVKPPASNPRADAIPRGRWAGKVRPGARRGVMSGHDLSEDAFRTLQSWGANLIRLQTGVGRKELERGADYFQAFSNRLDELAVHLDRCRRYGLKACIDLHSGPQAERTKHASNFIPADYDTTLLRRAWRMIATRFRDHPAVYGYDILNEPSCATETWQRIFAEVVADIRTIDAKTPVITESLAKYYPPEMNVIYSPHFYSPHVLTHYGVGTQWKIRWGYLNYINGEWWDKDQLRIAMQKYIDFSLAHPDARIYIGEFSCIAWVKNADAYIRDCTELFNEYGWDWTYHAFREWQPWDVEYEPAELYDTTVGHLRKAKTDTKRKEALLHGLRGATGSGAQSPAEDRRDSVMFFGAHPDDFESCVGLALRMKADYDIRIVDFTRGEGGLGEAGFRDGSTAERRMSEERAVAKAFDSEPIFLSAVNCQGRYAYANEKVTSEIEALLLKLRPKAVFVHWPVDEHPDHVQCAAAVQHALWNVRRDHRFKTELYFYNSPPWQTKNYTPTYYVDVTDQVDRMTEIISRYVCQDGPKIARNKRERMMRQGVVAPAPVAFAECYATFSGKPDPASILARYAIVGTASRPGYKVEHVAMDVADPVATANWWCENLGFEITMQKTDATHTTFIVDRTGQYAMELYRAKDAAVAPDYAKMSPLQLHVAFLSDDVDADIERMLKAGATLVVHEKAPGFDGAMMRDPSGIPLQFVKRGKPVLK